MEQGARTGDTVGDDNEETTGKIAGLENKEGVAGKNDQRKKKHYTFDVFHAWCKQCGICVAFCPVEVLAQDDAGYPYAKQPDACIGCMQCELRCPDFAITVIEAESNNKKRTSPEPEDERQGSAVA